MGVEIKGGPASLQIPGTTAFPATTLGPFSADQPTLTLGNATYYFISGNTPFVVYGMTGGADGRLVYMINTGTVQISFPHESATSPTAANRFHFDSGASSVRLKGDGAVSFIYDATLSRWRLISDVSSAKDMLIGGAWTFDQHDTTFGDGGIAPGSVGVTGFIHGASIASDSTIIDSGGGAGVLSFSLGGSSSSALHTYAVSAPRNYVWPNAGGTVVLDTFAQTLSSKTLAATTHVTCNPGVGPEFEDSTDANKNMVLDISGVTTGNTRVWGAIDHTGKVSISGYENVAAGGTVTAGKLGYFSNTVTATIAATKLVNTAPSAGLFKFTYYIMVATGAGGSTLGVTGTWNDGAARTGFTIVGVSSTATTGTLFNGSYPVYLAASQNFSFTLTIAGGTPSVDVRISMEAL